MSFKTSVIMVPLFKTLIRPVLEYGNVAWCPILKKHVLLTENVQRRFTKRIIGITNLNCEDRLKNSQLAKLGIPAGKGGHDRDIRYYMDFMISLALPLFLH